MSGETVSRIVQVLLVLLGCTGGGYGLLRYFNDRRKLKHESEHSDADTARILNSSAIGLLAPAREQVDFLRRELATTNRELTEYRQRIAKAEQEIETLSDHVRELTVQVRDLLDENERLRGGVHD